MADDRFEVLEVDQWTSTGNVEAQRWDDLKQAGIHGIAGGDSEAIRLISGGTFRFRTVGPKDTPSIARVWYRRNAHGYPERYLYYFDSSD